jgi:hypothetical protein
MTMSRRINRKIKYSLHQIQRVDQPKQRGTVYVATFPLPAELWL